VNAPSASLASRITDALRANRELAWALAAAWTLVFARSAVYFIYPQSFFDADQAIIGLMAKHLAEGRAFPLFYYGQTYLLGVDAWVAAAFFLVLGPTLGALRTSMIALNIAVSTLLVVGLHRFCGVRPLLALAASLFFTFAPPYTSASLVEAGANIGPLLFVPMLWMLRGRPLWFGAILGLGFRNREFTIYALPVLLAIELLQGTLLRPERIRSWLLAAASFLAVWQGVEALKPFSALAGPGTRGELIGGTAGSQVGNITHRVVLAPSELPQRVITMATDYMPRQVGAKFVGDRISHQGRDWMIWPLGLGMLAAMARVLALQRANRESAGCAMFAWYLMGVGLLAALAFAISRPIAEGVVDRYLLLTLYFPIGAAAGLLALESVRWSRIAMMALLAVWTMGSAVDHVKLAARYWGGKEPNATQELADGLIARRIRVASATYWTAYKVTFLTGERVKIASTDIVRIEEYQRLAEKAGDRLVRISDRPCNGERVSVWYLCPAQ
jgi:hypothetical protein